MVLLGTIINTISVAVGSTLGLLVGKSFSSKAQTGIVVIFGLFTLAISTLMVADMNEPIHIFLALVIGFLIGELLGLHTRFSKFAKQFHVEVEQSVANGFIKATLLFCVGGMTLVGCMNEGISGDYNLIFLKSLMDLISSFFLASALGRGVLFSSAGVFIIQGSLTLAFFMIGSLIPAELLADLTATGGILLLALGLDLINVKKFQILDLVPAFLILPIIHYAHIYLL